MRGCGNAAVNEHSLEASTTQAGHSPVTPVRSREGLHDLLAGVGTAAASLAVYLATLQPGVGGSGDSRMFQLLAAVPGTSNYPTHLIALEFMKTVLPFVDPAVRANLLSSIAGAASSGIMVLLLRRLGARRAVAVGTSLAFSWTATHWVLSIYAEVYTLNLLFLLVAVLLLLRWQHDQDRLLLAIALAVVALGFGIHNTSVLVIPGVLVFLWWVDRSLFRSGWFVIAVMCAAVVTLLPYGLLVCRTFDPDVAFLGASAGDLGKLIDLLMGGGNRSNLFQQSLTSIVTQRLPRMAATIATQLHLLLPLAVVGVWRRPTAGDALLQVTLLCNLALVASYSVPDLAVFYLPALAMLAVLAGRGFEVVLRRLHAPPTLALGLSVALPAVFLVPNWVRVAEAHDTATKNWIQRVLRVTEDPSLIVALNWDMATALKYATEVERARPDRKQVLFYPWSALSTSFGFERVRRHVCGGPPLRVQPRGRIAERGGRVYVAEQRPALIDGLRRRGYELRRVERHLYELGPVDCRPPPLPAVLLIHEVESRPTLNAAIASVTTPDFDPRNRVVLQRRPAGIERSDGPRSPRNVEIVEWSDSRIEIEVDATAPGWLVITDIVPGFWRARIDGVGVETSNANVIHRGLPVPAGRHTVTLRDPAGDFRLGEWLTGRPTPLTR